MASDIVKFTTDGGEAVEITAKDVKNVLCPAANDKEVAMFLALCKAQRLNPFIRDAYLVKYGNNPASIITGKEALNKRASAQPDYLGFEAGIVYLNAQGEVCKREGSAVYKDAEEKLIGAWARVFVEGKKPFYDEVSLSEYSTGKSGWAKMPATMARKVALTHAWREAYPEAFQGLYSAEEMDATLEAQAPAPIMENAKPAKPAKPTKAKASKAKGAPKKQAPAKKAEAEAVAVEAEALATDEQAAAINDRVKSFAELAGRDQSAVYDALYASKTMTAAGAKQGEGLTETQAAKAIALLDAWIEKQMERNNEAERAKAEQAAQAAEMADEDIPF